MVLGIAWTLVKTIESIDHLSVIDVPAQLQKRARKRAEAEKKKAEAEKTKAEAEKTKRGGKGKQAQQGAGANSQAEEEEEEEEEIGEVSTSVQWHERGIPNFGTTEAYSKRAIRGEQRPGVDDVSLSKSALDKMPKLDEFMDALDPETGKFPIKELALTCFDLNFPPEAAKLMAEKVGLCLLWSATKRFVSGASRMPPRLPPSPPSGESVRKYSSPPYCRMLQQSLFFFFGAFGWWLYDAMVVQQPWAADRRSRAIN